MFTSLKRTIHQGWVNFSRNLGLNLATILVMIMTVFQVSSLLLFYQASKALISNIREKADISVYFKENSPEEEILKIKDDVSTISEVKNVEYVSKDEALEKFIQRHKEDPVLMESLKEIGDNPFLPALNIRAQEASQYSAVTSFLEKAPFKNLIYKVDYYQRKSVIDKISSLTSVFTFVEILFIVIFGVISVFVAFNTIRLAIYSCREEISIMRLVGASNWFIRGPFLIQGIICGLLSALITFLISGTAFYLLGTKTGRLFGEIDIFRYFLSNFFLILLIQIVIGIGLGIISSLIAVRKYLKI